MKKSILILAVVALVFAGILAIQPQTAKAAATVYHFRFVGMGAEAGFSTCDWSSVPAAGTVCTDTYINVAEYVYSENGTQFPSSFMNLYQVTYKFDRNGNWIYVSDSWGWGEATLTIDRKLSKASASATIQLSTCTVDRRGRYSCTESTLPVSASWTGKGDIVRSSGHWRSVSKGFTYNSSFSGSYREASASIQGVDAGSLMWAWMYNSKSKDVYVSRGSW